MSSHSPRIQRSHFQALAPDAVAALVTLGGAAREAGVDEGLLELAKLRVSQVNGCAFCVQYHLSLARRLGVSRGKLDLVVAWRETDLFDERERAALGWAESLTSIAQTGAPDAVYEEARAVFSEGELAGLTASVAAINAWNRIAVGFRYAPELPERRAEAA